VTEHFLKSAFLSMCSVLCAYAAKLLYISLPGTKITITSNLYGHETVGMAMLLDTGSDLTYLHKDVYDQVLSAVSSSNILNYLLLLCR
jgi:hypothetical protein